MLSEWGREQRDRERQTDKQTVKLNRQVKQSRKQRNDEQKKHLDIYMQQTRAATVTHKMTVRKSTIQNKVKIRESHKNRRITAVMQNSAGQIM